MVIEHLKKILRGEEPLPREKAEFNELLLRALKTCLEVECQPQRVIFLDTESFASACNALDKCLTLSALKQRFDIKDGLEDFSKAIRDSLKFLARGFRDQLHAGADLILAIPPVMTHRVGTSTAEIAMRVNISLARKAEP